MMKKRLTFSHIRADQSLFFLLSLTTLLAFTGGLLLASHLAGPASPGLEGEAVVTAYGETLARVYSKVLPSVVRIEVTASQAPSAVETNPGSSATPIVPRPVSPSKGSGSGFVWDQAGHIVTNFHIIH
jgi:S1-C subfamily serine protease